MIKPAYLFALAASCAFAQPAMHLTLAEAQRLAVQNNPRLTAAQYTAAAAAQVPKEYRAAYEPTAFASLTGVGADPRVSESGLNEIVALVGFGGAGGAAGGGVGVPTETPGGSGLAGVAAGAGVPAGGGGLGCGDKVPGRSRVLASVPM